MPRRLSPETVTARGNVLRDRETVIKRYQGNESMATLSREYGVHPEWLAGCLAAWGVPRRTRAQVAALAWAQQTGDKRLRPRRRKW
ncbi:hypothetical protein [Streptomyces yaizuensis]|uniref:Uncharacterized protein n=1 Tax=Streptomyces yaizuensis TaxID=2989713 RepID=A0ABQ5PB22_9ACTN|nr:hypothetical protein [Streptomyces sp. YSPA8]GLF99792.1 hypothetical protein SYYSPA8_35865 [Streptomyces sp. YSPA8]